VQKCPAEYSRGDIEANAIREVVVREDPRITRSRALILSAARRCFAARGYDDTSVDDVATEAGIAKRTIYNIFGDKESLFRAAVTVSMGIAENFTRDVALRVTALTDPEKDLPALARRLADDVLAGPVVPLRRLVARESSRFPDLAAEYRDRAPEAVVRALSSGFADLARRGLLRIDDPDAAAEQFAYLVLGPDLDRRMFGDLPSTAAERHRRADASARAFLRLYGVPRVADAAVTQYAVLDALLAGAYESGMPVGEVAALGDFGIGCCDHLGGEVVILDGEVFECTVAEPPTPMADEETLPFADICRFTPGPVRRVADADLAGLTAGVEDALASRNLFHAVRVDGLLASVRVRVTPRQELPLPPLAEVTAHQVETVLTGIRGTLVGFWTPAIYQGISVAGLHLHFLADDRTVGGHVLDVAVAEAAMQVAAYARFHLRLPTDPAFLATELTHDEDHRIVAVEGGARRGLAGD
jgi:acetolactate decarboxylase